MNFVKRDISAFASETAAGFTTDGFAVPAVSGRKWPISYRSVEFIALGADVGIILLAGILAGAAYHYEALGQTGDIVQYFGSAAVVAALFVSLAKVRELYKPAELLNLKAQFRGIALIWSGVFLFLAAVVFTLKIGEEFSRGATLSFAGLGFGLLLSSRVIWRNLLKRGLAEWRFSGRNVALVLNCDLSAAPNTEQVLIANLLRHGLQIKHRFLLPTSPTSARARSRLISEIIDHLRGSDVHEIVISSDLNGWSELSDLCSDLRKLPLPVHLIPLGPTSDLLKRPAHRMGETVCIELQRGPLSTFERSIKRGIDVLGAGLGLLALLPLLAATAIAIKLDSPGPVLFRQRRCGFNGKPFHILKFRTMTVLEDGECVPQAMPSDKRATRLGSALRRTSIDELPQLLNVLSGSMSLVGPRPHAVAHDSQFDKLVSNYAFRHHVKPGLTGWAQVNGYRGPTPTFADIRHRVDYDLWYINNWSLALDLLILVRTILRLREPGTRIEAFVGKAGGYQSRGGWKKMHRRLVKRASDAAPSAPVFLALRWRQ